MARREAFSLGETEIRPGRRAQIELPLARLVTGTRVGLPVQVLHGSGDGPTVWLDAAIHGDEVGGVEVVRRVVAAVDPRRLAGTLLAVPIVNVHGFVGGDRYLPDRRDLNRSFPGSPRGSLAAQIAHLFMTEVVGRCEVGIDLHTGSDHRTNLPHVRADLDDPRTWELAEAFAPPLVMHARTRDGSLRQAAADAGATVLLFEGGEAWRFDERAIAAATDGIRRVLHHLDMVDDAPPVADGGPLVSRSSRWVRARRAGLVHLEVGLGDRLAKGDVIAVIHDSFGNRLSRATAPDEGVVIGALLRPLVNRGDAIAHIAEIA